MTMDASVKTRILNSLKIASVKTRILNSLKIDYLQTRILNSLKIAYVVTVFVAALSLGALKAISVGPVAAMLLITGNISIIVGLFPAHVVWTVQSLVKTPRFGLVLKIILLLILPVVAVLWLVIGIVGSILVAVGYGIFTPWIATFEAFRRHRESSKFIHCITDGTWSTIKGSCTVVRDFLDLCYHSYHSYLKECCEKSSSDSEPYDIKIIVQLGTFQHRYCIYPKFKDQGKNKLDKMLLAGYIYDVDASEWVSLVVLEKKKDKIWICVDYHALNKVTK